MLAGYKTYIAAGIAAITAIAAYLTGDADITTTVQNVAGALAIAFLRNGMPRF